MNFPAAKLKFTKQSIIDAGETLSGKSSALEVGYAWGVLDYWRSLHQTPLHYISKNLTAHARKADKNSLVVRRLKRAPSIFSKLNRENDLTLRKMQDIGGCRAIVSDLAAVLKLSQSFRDSRQHHKLERIKDYITTPKPSGYRGVHLIYKFQSSDPINQSFNGLRVEIQLRSIQQHLWATAVEIVGIITKQSLKSSQGEADWIDFFKLMSSGIACDELKQPIPFKTLKEISRLERKLDVRKKLGAYSLALKHVKDNEANFYVLELSGTNLKISSFKDEVSANEVYLDAEKRLIDENSADIVLVGAKSFHDLKRAYPNYFGDSVKFLKVLENFLERQKSPNALARLFRRL